MARPTEMTLQSHFTRLRDKYKQTDQAINKIDMVLEGRIDELAPDQFSADAVWGKPLVANTILNGVEYISEAISPLPTFICNTNDTKKAGIQRASTKTKVIQSIVKRSNLAANMLDATKWLTAYGFVVGKIEIDHENQSPVMRILSPKHFYPDLDVYGNVIRAFQVVDISQDALIDLYPNMKSSIKAAAGVSGKVQTVIYHDKERDLLCVVDQAGGISIIGEELNLIGKVLYTICKRPGVGDVPRGQFDDVIGAMLAKNSIVTDMVAWVHENVNSPWFVPLSADGIDLGPGAVVQTDEPEKYIRKSNPVDGSSFQQVANLDREVSSGSRIPDIKSGVTNASVITGAGTDSLLGGFEGQVQAYRTVLLRWYTHMAELALEVDEKVFGKLEKKISSFGSYEEFKYKPADIIKGDYTVEVRFGNSGGLNAANATVQSLQLLGSKAMSMSTFRKNSIFDMDPEEEERLITAENLEAALVGSLEALVGTIPQIQQAGGDPSDIIVKIAAVIEGVRAGKDKVTLILEAFTPPEPEEPVEEPVDPNAADPMAQQELEAGIGVSGSPAAISPGEVPGSKPPLQKLLAGLNSSGETQLSTQISRQTAIR